MEPELKEKSTVATESKINTDLGGSLAPFSVSDDPTEQMKAYAAKAVDVLSNLPDYLGSFFADYRQPIVTAGLFFGAFVGVKLTFALLAALNEIPLVEPGLELIGLTYTAWFVYRYIIKADNRQELSSKYNGVKDQVFGKK
jgi:CAAD domains of cyanobacterial aminoacyl-tRNA synthetase